MLPGVVDTWSLTQGCNSVFSSASASGCDELRIKIFGKDQDLNSPYKLGFLCSSIEDPAFRASSSSHHTAKMAGSRFVVGVLQWLGQLALNPFVVENPGQDVAPKTTT